MTTHDWLKQFIFTHTRIFIPDGRPLYAYKCTEKKYLELKSMVSKLLLADLKNESAKQVPAIFCLYAAETFSREHTGGIWTWETVFHPLGMDIPERHVIEHWVKNGLDWWCRPILLGQNGYRRFLVSIACEGGLPLRLLENDSAAINHFFRSILENYHKAGCGGSQIAQQLAVLNADRLPPVLRQDVVFHLSGELISSVVDLQTKYEIGRVKNPIAVLDEKDSNWRRTLPLRVEDGVAEALFNGLLIDSGKLARAANAKLRWIGKLHQTEAGYKIEKVLELPEIVSGELVQQWLGQNSELPPRLQFVLNTNLGSQTIARLTLCAGSGETARYRRELLRKDGVRLFNEEVSEVHSLFLHDGQKEYPLDVKSGEFWNEALPWIFTEKSATNEYEFFGEGSVRTKEEQVFVLANETLKPHVFGTGSFEALAYIQELNRTVWRVVGEVDFVTEELDRYRIACKAEDDLSESCQIVGDILHEANNSQLIYRGLPNIKIENKTKGCYRTQWRAVNGGKGWQDCNFDDLAFGHVWLRLQNKEDGNEIYRRKILVVPKSFKIETVIGGADSTNGIYRLKGFKGAVISTDLQSETSMVSDDNIEINCPILESTNLPDLSIAFHWTTANLQIKLPYPQRGAIFQMAGQTLHYGDCVHVDRLGGLRLFLQDSVGGQSYWIDAELIAEDRKNADLPRLRFSNQLPILTKGRSEVSLISWQERIISLLNSSRKLDSYVSLKITSKKGECLANIQIARFDCVVQPNFSGYQVYLPSETIARLGDDWQQRVTMEMFPLWSPKGRSVPLEVNLEQFACWNVPNDLENGIWWIVARDGDWARFRPLLWGVTNEISNKIHDSELVTAIREDNHEQREILLHNVLKELGENFSHSDWELMFDLIVLSREFPTSSLDVLTHLVSHPQTLALALLKADDESFHCVWLLAEQIPFAWGLLSVHCWEKATQLYFRGLREAIGDIDLPRGFYFDIFQKFRERTASSGREYWQSLCDWLQERIFKGHELGNSPLLLARRSPKVFEGQIIIAEQELQARHSATEEWVKSIEIMHRVKKGFIDEKNQYQHIFNDDLRAVRCAPFVAANLSIKGIPLDKNLLSELKAKDDGLEWISLRQLYPYIITDNLIYELRLIRSFDPEWFDRTYAIALTLELARLPVELT